MFIVSWLYEDRCSLFSCNTSPAFERSLHISWDLICWITCHFSSLRCFSCSTQILINLDGIHSFSSPVDTNVKSLSQCNTYPGFHTEVNTSLKYTGWFSFAAAVTPFSLTLRKFNVNEALCNL